MKKTKKLLALLLAVGMAASILAGCNAKEIDSSSIPEVTTVTTSAPVTTTTATTTEATTTEATTTTAPVTTKAPAKTTVAKPTTTKAPAATTTKAPAVTTAAPVTTAPGKVEPPKTGTGKYVYNNVLSADEKHIYDSILKAITNHEATATFNKSFSSSTIMKVYLDVFYQEAQLFWLQGNTNAAMTANSISLDYKYDVNTTATMQKKMDEAIVRIKGKFPKSATTAQKLKVIHDDLILRTAYSKDGPYATSAYGPLVDGTAQCEGYAKGLTYVCNAVGIENVRINGMNPEGGSHAWNKVQVDGKWYVMDLTWDDPKDKPANYMRYNYFCVPDSQIKNDRTITSEFKQPVANSLDANYNVLYGKYATSADDAAKKMQAEFIASGKTKNSIAAIKCDSKATYDAAKTKILGTANAMKKVANGTAGVNQIGSIADASAPDLLLIVIILNY